MTESAAASRLLAREGGRTYGCCLVWSTGPGDMDRRSKEPDRVAFEAFLDRSGSVRWMRVPCAARWVHLGCRKNTVLGLARKGWRTAARGSVVDVSLVELRVLLEDGNTSALRK